MNIVVNGSSMQIDSGKTVSDLIELMKVGNKRFAVEINDEIIPRGDHATHTLSDNDKIEIVHAIGGG